MIIALAAAGAGIAVLIGWMWQAGSGVVRSGSGERVRPADVAVPGDAFGRTATLLLFTSRQDDQLAVHVRLRALAAEHEGVAVAEVDLTARGDLAGRYAVTRTPSVLVLDGEGRLRARVKGPADAAVLRDALARALPGG